MKMRYRVHRFDIDMTKDQSKLEQFLNNLEGEVVAIIPSVNPKFTVRGGCHGGLSFSCGKERVRLFSAR
jgi:hypothetical protein